MHAAQLLVLTQSWNEASSKEAPPDRTLAAEQTIYRDTEHRA